jgi:hypothetical protein
MRRGEIEIGVAASRQRAAFGFLKYAAVCGRALKNYFC